ncbi:MAG: glycosyltransferase family 4 protein [Lachnospiraceae bacterium]|nr:glycosyltransferase family 4 protein [Lachnospiraceae bacterium]
MKILWLCSLVLPDFAGEFGIKRNPISGWITGLMHGLEADKELQIALCFPIYDEERMKDGVYNAHPYYSYKTKPGFCSVNYAEAVERFKNILRHFEPDIVHIWGTEFIHSAAMLEACETMALADRVIVDIQGLTSVCAMHFNNGVPDKYRTLKSGEFITIEERRQVFIESGRVEEQLLKKARYAFVRTDWDRACVARLNPDIRFFECYRILRDSFYKSSGLWNVSACRRYSIFVSQAYYSVKGFHYLLQAMPDILQVFPEAHIYVAGLYPVPQTEEEAIKGTSPYGVFINDLVSDMNLHNKITYLGPLCEEEMVEQFLASHVFVSASVIENSSNSVCEAALLGVPVVSSYVGGLANLLTDKESVLFYQTDAPYMLAYYICSIFGDDSLAVRLSANASAHIAEIMDSKAISQQVADAYEVVGRGR